MPKSMFTDRDYLEAQFGGIRELLQDIAKTTEAQDNRIRRLEQDISGAKLLGKTALGVSAVIGGVVGWAAEITPKLVAFIHK